MISQATFAILLEDPNNADASEFLLELVMLFAERIWLECRNAVVDVMRRAERKSFILDLIQFDLIILILWMIWRSEVVTDNYFVRI